MVTWERFEGSDAEWDSALGAASDACAFQGSRWAAHKADSGWSAVRLRSKTAIAQFLVKRAGPGVAVAWARGGPAGAISAVDPGLLAALRAAAGTPLVYARLCSYRPVSTGDERALRAAGWTRCRYPLDKDTTMILDLSPDPARIEESLTANWRHNLKRGRKRCASVRLWENPRPAEMASVYRAMESFKNMTRQHDEGALRSMIERLAGSLVVFRADDENGDPIALRAATVEHGRAWDLLAATSPAGRKSYAAYAVFWEQILECRRRGAAAIDLGGVDPEGNKGVFDFKRGTGAAMIRFLGEWDAAAPPPLRPLAQAVIKLRGL